jgi:hypothetical protein
MFPGADGRKPRRCLWLYKDKSSVSPRCRLWVDGAVVVVAGPAGTEGTLVSTREGAGGWGLEDDSGV